MVLVSHSLTPGAADAIEVLLSTDADSAIVDSQNRIFWPKNGPVPGP
jgi:hypothetical protein